jgi:uncharacterized protein YbjT (DUF2867 family)
VTDLESDARLGPTAVIAGASGLVGRYCLQALLGHYARVTVLTRRKLAVEHPRLKQQVIQFEEISELDIHADDFFSALGGHPNDGGWAAFTKVEFDYPRALAERAAECGARQFLCVTTVDAKHTSSFRRYTKMKRQLEAILAKLPLHAVHVFRPGLLRGEREHPRRDERWMHALIPPLAPLMIGRFSKFRPVAAQELGRAMVAAALRRKTGFHIYHHNEIRSLAASLTIQA